MRYLRWLEVAIGVLFTAITLPLHRLYWQNAGPLWRDEVDSLVIAQRPFGTLLHWMQFDSFPACWLLLVRGWVRLFGDGVASLRTMGVLTGLLLLAAIWFALRTLGVRAPMLAIALAAATATVVRYGDSHRAYGFSAVVGLLSLALLYRTIVKPTPLSFVLAAVASLAAANTTYHNAQLLFACCVAAAIVHRDRKRSAIVLGIGALCAASLLVYLPTMRKVKAWSDLVRYDVDLHWIVAKFSEAANATAWTIALTIALALAGFFLWHRRGQNPALLYTTLVLVIYTVAQTIFLLNLGFIMQPWYFLLWIVVAAVLVDAIIAMTIDAEPALHLVRAAAAAFIILIAYDGTKEIVSLRSTNLDLAAATIEREATPRDYVVVYPWHLGASFNRYYHGRAAWQTLPPLPDQSVQRYDEAQKAITDMRERSVVARVAATLDHGGRVWFAGLPLFVERVIYVHESTKVNPRVEADNRWCNELQDAMRAHAGASVVVMPPSPDVAPAESVALLRIDPKRP